MPPVILDLSRVILSEGRARTPPDSGDDRFCHGKASSVILSAAKDLKSLFHAMYLQASILDPSLRSG